MGIVMSDGRCIQTIPLIAAALILSVPSRTSIANQLTSWLPAWVPNPSGEAILLSGSDIANWSFGGFGGVYNHGRLTYIEVEPWRVEHQWGDGYMVGANAVWKFARLPGVPIDLEVDLSAGYLWGQGSL